MLPSQALFLLCHLDNDLVLTINHYIYIFIYSEVHPVPTARRPLIRLSHGVQTPPGLCRPPPISSFDFCGLINVFCGTALMPRSSRSAEEKSRRAEEDRDRRAAESPASRQARLASNSEKKRERRAAESPASRQARLASDKRQGCNSETPSGANPGVQHHCQASELRKGEGAPCCRIACLSSGDCT